MSIRTHNKDHLRELAEPLAEAPLATSESPDTDDLLRFWTLHEKPVFVDLTVFRDGESERPLAGGSWVGPFAGRPQLIADLALTIRAVVEHVAPDTVISYKSAIREWWRLFDSVEAVSSSIAKVSVLTDITDIHRQCAHDSGMLALHFRSFLRIVNVARQGNGLARFYWDAPESSTGKRHLPPPAQVDQIRFALKHAWFRVLHRWERADMLVARAMPQSAEEARLRRNYRRFRFVSLKVSVLRPTSDALSGNVPKSTFAERGYIVGDMLRGLYPDGYDIRVAFHLCLANTGWNPSVLLNLDINDDFLTPHPKDPSRYLLQAVKNRGGDSEQVVEGLFKSQGSAGVILQMLILRTQPLRERLRQDLVALKVRYQDMQLAGAPHAALKKCWQQIVSMSRGVNSPWLYMTAKKKAVCWLADSSDYSRGLTRDVSGGFLGEFIAEINKKQPKGKKVSVLRAGDFRDAFAGYAYRVSGGLVLYVMKALRHKHLRSTITYLDNTFVNEESEGLYRTFSNALWDEIKFYGRVDPTIIAKHSQDGKVSEEERNRLHSYRQLMRSRIGVGCKDPANPPVRIAPDFNRDGQSLCSVQRCTLCWENAVLFPESLPGLCKRLAELRYLKTHMSAVAFMQSSFDEELANTELALRHFDSAQVNVHVAEWERRISTGEHRVIQFDGIPEGV